MIEPLLADDVFLADVDAACGEPGLHVWWLGQSGFLVQHAGRHLLLDPYLSDSLTRKYAGTATPHVRLTRRVVAPTLLGFVDVVASTHRHTDHLDPDTLAPIVAGGSLLVCAAGDEELAAGRSGRLPAASLGVGDSVELASFCLEAVRASHEGAPGAVGYVVRTGNYRVYHAGDTISTPALTAAVTPHGVDLALLPVNGRVGNMDGVAAARLAHAIGARLAVPCHIEMFAFNTASPKAFVEECARLGQSCSVLRAGERLTVAP